MNWRVVASVALFCAAAVATPASDDKAPPAASASLALPASTATSTRAPASVTRALPAPFGEGEYRVGPEDVVEIFVWKEPDLTRVMPVRPDGKISLPLAGEIEASGKTAPQLQAEITGRLTHFISSPVVTVTVKEINYPKISVLGQVRKPDRYRIKQRITALEAVAMAGGFTEFAKRDKIIIIRQQGNDEKRMQIDLKKVLKDGRSDAFYLEPFDTVYVE